MADIARITFNSSTDFYEVMDMLDKRLNDKGKNWRHVLKSLKVLDYCLHEGSELVVTWARKNVYIIKTLREFIYLDEEGRDVGASSMSHSKPQNIPWLTQYSPTLRQGAHLACHGRRASPHRARKPWLMEVARHRARRYGRDGRLPRRTFNPAERKAPTQQRQR